MDCGSQGASRLHARGQCGAVGYLVGLGLAPTSPYSVFAIAFYFGSSG